MTTRKPAAKLPSIPSVTLSLDETGDYPMLTVLALCQMTPAQIALCHTAAGNLGAGIRFFGPR